MNCQQARDRLTSLEAAPSSTALDSHLASCGACRSYAARLDEARRILREHHGNVQPDPGFATRVVSRLPAPTSETLGWAALRLIPVTLVLVVVLAWFAIDGRTAVQTTDDTSAPTDDLVSWVIEDSGTQP